MGIFLLLIGVFGFIYAKLSIRKCVITGLKKENKTYIFLKTKCQIYLWTQRIKFYNSIIPSTFHSAQKTKRIFFQKIFRNKIYFQKTCMFCNKIQNTILLSTIIDQWFLLSSFIHLIMLLWVAVYSSLLLW